MPDEKSPLINPADPFRPSPPRAPSDTPEMTFSPQDQQTIEMLKKVDPRAYAVARAFEVRRRLSQEMTEYVKNPAALNNRDLLDYLRDRAREKGQQFVVRRDKHQPKLIHIFMRDPVVEQLNLVPDQTNNQWLGWVEKNTEPTPDRGDG